MTGVPSQGTKICKPCGVAREKESTGIGPVKKLLYKREKALNGQRLIKDSCYKSKQ